MDTTPPPRTILRYANRKMYDAATSKAVTAEIIVELVKTGVPLRIQGCTDKLDHTQAVLCSVLNRMVRRHKLQVDSDLLLRTITSLQKPPEDG